MSIVGSITPVAARRFEVGKGREVDIDDGFERVCCRAVLEAVWECCEPVGVLNLQCEQCAGGATPTLRAATSIGRTAGLDDGRDNGPGVRRCSVCGHPLVCSLAAWPCSPLL